MVSRLLKGRTISLVYILLIVILVSVNFWNFIYYYNTTKNKTNVQIEFQRNKTEVTLTVLDRMFANGQIDLALDFIEAGKTLSYFDFFEVRKNGQVLSKSSNYQISDSNVFPEDANHLEIRSNDTTYYISKKKFGQYEVIVGYLPANENILSASKVFEILKDNIKDTVVFFLCIFVLVFREYFNQLKYMKAGRRDLVEKLNPISTEGKFFKDLFIHASNLTQKKISLEVPDGVETELARGTLDGDHFFGGMVRIDLNNYTPLCDQYGDPTIDSLLSPIFSEFREIAQRYGFYEVADEGDERVFYHRSSDQVETGKRGIGMIRSFFEASANHAAVVKERRNIDLIFKASFAYDGLTLKKEDGKFKIKGRSFSISKRCIGIFKKLPEDKKYFTIGARKSDVNEASSLIKEAINEMIELEGFGKNEVLIVKELYRSTQSPVEIQYYLSNSDIQNHLKRFIKDWNEKDFWTLYKVLQNIKIIIKDPAHGDLLFELLQKLQKEHQNPEIIASIIMLIPKVASTKDVSLRNLEYLKQFLKSENIRIGANTLEALGALGVFAHEARSYMNAENNRVRANALVIVGKKDVGDEITKNLQQLLYSNKELEVSSALYVIDQLFSFHYNQDLTLFKTASFFQIIMKDLKIVGSQSSEKIRQRSYEILDNYENI